MSSEVKILRTPAELRTETRRWHGQGRKYALVPTMGALHPGHLALVTEAFRHADVVAASIFINPRQFGKREDLSRYPRKEAEDYAMLAKAGVTLVYAPPPETMYPPGFATTVTLAGPAAAGLEDKFRPGFFPGVATVVSKLLAASEADFAMFGEKDYQQLKVVTQLVRDLDLATEIIAVPTVREVDGLALSSRNAYLTSRQRAAAPLLYRSLADAAHAISKGKTASRAIAAARQNLRKAGFRVDYVACRNAETLAPANRRPSRCGSWLRPGWGELGSSTMFRRPASLESSWPGTDCSHRSWTLPFVRVTNEGYVCFEGAAYSKPRAASSARILSGNPAIPDRLLISAGASAASR
jgi:pantoate--beta-alanine ligase